MINIIYNDNNITVCEKPVGYSSQQSNGKNMIDELKTQLNSEIYPVHRLDTAVGGIMVFAKTKKASAELSKQITENSIIKEYIAIVENHPETKEGIFEDLLFRDSRKNKSFVVKRMRNGVKKAKLQYDVLGKKDNTTFVHIRLFTGRTHQIRVQFASRKMPLIGDGKYGSKINSDIALFSYKLTFVNPSDGKSVSFSLLPDTENSIWNNYKDIISCL